LRKKYILELTKALLKARDEQIEASDIFNMVKDIIVYLENGDSDKYEMMQ